MRSSAHDGSLEARRDALRRALATVGDFRQGSLTPRYIKCGKANCHCAHEGAQGHGPYWSLTREVNGKTRTRTVPGTALERVREQIAEYHRFRSLVRDMVEVNCQLCDAQIDEDRQAGQGRKNFAAMLTAEIAAEVEHLAGAGPEVGLDFEAVETAVRRTALQLMGQALARALNVDHGDDHSPRLFCTCGHTAGCTTRRSGSEGCASQPASSKGADLRLTFRINELEKISGVYMTLCQQCVTEWPDV